MFEKGLPILKTLISFFSVLRTHVNKTTGERELVHRRKQAIDKVKTEVAVMQYYRYTMDPILTIGINRPSIVYGIAE